MRYAQLVIGPAGSGKSTYCKAIVQHALDSRRPIEVVNLDPAAEHFSYEPSADIRELINVHDTMVDEELAFGPNGGLIYCMDYLLENSDWLRDKLGDQDDDYILFDCPGQIELYIHLETFRKLIRLLRQWDFNICSVFLLDVQFMIDGSKFLSGTMAALCAMVNLELPHVNLLSKMDLLSKSDKRKLERFLEPDCHAILGDIETRNRTFDKKHKRLSEAIGRLVEDYSLVRFVPIDLRDRDSLESVLVTVDTALQYGEDREVRVAEFEEYEPDAKDD